METLWFVLVAAMLAVYVVLDGFDLGAGVLHLFVARTDEERSRVLAAIGPVWDGNEVWLIAAGGTLLCAFPALYAASFSGFYLPLMIVLWLLIFRGLAIELRGHVQHALWRRFWDVAFAAASTLLALFFGVAFGNVARGVTMDAEGRFFAPLWTDLTPGGPAGILDWYTVLVGAAAVLALALHGALWLVLRGGGLLEERARTAARRLAPLATTGFAMVSLASCRVQPHALDRLAAAPWGAIFPLVGLTGPVLAHRLIATHRARAAFAASSAGIAGMMGAAVFGLWPWVLPCNTDPGLGLTVYEAAASAHGLKVALAWWLPGMALATGYTVFVYRWSRQTRGGR